MYRKTLPTLLFALLLFASCEEEKGDIYFDQDAFERERAAWEAQGVRDYLFTLDLDFPSSHPPGPNWIQVEVRNGVATQALWEESGQPLKEHNWRAADHVRNYATIDSLYAQIDEFYLRKRRVPQKAGEYLSIEVTYSANHYPVSIACSLFLFSQAGLMGGNGSWSAQIKNFSAISE